MNASTSTARWSSSGCSRSRSWSRSPPSTSSCSTASRSGRWSWCARSRTRCASRRHACPGRVPSAPASLVRNGPSEVACLVEASGRTARRRRRRRLRNAASAEAVEDVAAVHPAGHPAGVQPVVHQRSPRPASRGLSSRLVRNNRRLRAPPTRKGATTRNGAGDAGEAADEARVVARARRPASQRKIFEPAVNFVSISYLIVLRFLMRL